MQYIYEASIDCVLVLKVPFEKAAPPLPLRIGGGSGGAGTLAPTFFRGALGGS